ncbi:DUF2786 domain-containing protein [Streptomyces sp. ISL-44]|uniref:DUF2786 domain-containing protein n=1 Tax=Streptomyces sp. ISL-44 TaxID=2819184 RepID=UPI001BEB3C96|nr:DUF2786 domain-containing protein [Streptomyces sp. ISL-44]MBT2544489.1 DUF2786 domain-containing protein [Streptomyces sp. ISL-44]
MATPMPEDGKLAKIRAILAKAEDPATSPEEADAYFAKAAELMAKYGIEKAMLADADPSQDRPGDRIIKITGTYANDREFLLGYIVDALGCKGINLRSGEVHLFGYESELERVEMLFTSLQLQAFNAMRHGRPRPGEKTITYRKSFLAGFMLTIYARLKEIEARARQEAAPSATGRSAELVLADRKAVTLARFTREYPNTRNGGGARRGGSGKTAGEAAGRRADLGQTRVGGRRAIAA